MEQISNWKVKLETPLTSELRKSEEDELYYMVYHHTQYEFTVAEALEYICCDENSYMFDGMMLHNIVLRDAMRKYGVKEVVDRIRGFAPKGQKLEERFNRFIDNYPDGCIGNLDIQVYSVIEDIEILGFTFHGLEDIAAHREISLCERHGSNMSASRRMPQKRGRIHVGEVWQSYPCFDSHDYATETRTYQNYVIRKKIITDDDMQQVKDLPSNDSLRKINEDIPIDVLPLIYYSGDGGFMLVANRRKD